MTETTESKPSRPRRRWKRYVAIAAVALLIVVAAAGWMMHEAWKRFSSGAGLFQGMEKGMEALGQGLQTLGTEFSNGAAFSQQFIADLGEDRLENAYQATSKSFKQQMTEERFDTFVRRHPGVNDGTVHIDFVLSKKSASGTVSASGNVTSTSTRITPGQGSVSFDKNKSPRKVKLMIVDENGALKVDRLELGEDKAP
jgi:hypothetical protein